MKGQADLSANETIYDAIRQIAFHKVINPRTHTLKNTSRTSGYIVKIHTDASDELLGTVDVQEYIAGNETDVQAYEEGEPIGLHEGVYLSAIQNNENGVLILPFLYSDVVIATDPETLREYVVQYSHADTIQIDAHNKVIVGVSKTKDYKDSDDELDVEDLERTGEHGHTIYTPQSVLTVVGKNGEGTKDNKDGHNEYGSIDDVSGSDASAIEVTPDKVEAKHDKAQLILDAQQLLAKYDAKEIVIKSDGVYVGKASAKEPAVLGDQLAQLLLDWLSAMTQMMTPTHLGPQPPANVAQFAQLQAKVNSYKAAVSGFLSKTVKIAE